MIFKKKTTIPQKQEQTRSWLAKALVTTLMGTIVLTFTFVGTEMLLKVSGKDVETQDFREILTLVLTSETALVGTALGFYFGSQNSDES